MSNNKIWNLFSFCFCDLSNFRNNIYNGNLMYCLEFR